MQAAATHYMRSHRPHSAARRTAGPHHLYRPIGNPCQHAQEVGRCPQWVGALNLAGCALHARAVAQSQSRRTERQRATMPWMSGAPSLLKGPSTLPRARKRFTLAMLVMAALQRAIAMDN